MGDKFRAIRNAMGLSQKDFAAKLGIKQAYYSMIEQGKKEPSIKVIDALWGLGVSFNWYYDDKGEMFVDVFNVDNNSDKNIDNSNISMYAKFVEGVSNNTCDLIESNYDFLTSFYYGNPLFPYHYEYMQIKYYNSLSLKRIKELLTLEKDAYEKAYNDDVSLTDFLHYLNPPDFLKEKFAQLQPFPEYFKKYMEEFKEETEELNNEKLKDILLIIRLKESTEDVYSGISKVIEYMKIYKNLIVSKLKSETVSLYEESKR